MYPHIPLDGNDFVKTILRMVIMGMTPANSVIFISRITGSEFAPDIQVKVYEFAKALIRSWAGKTDLSHEDAAVIEDCRKICDMMGWPPIQ